MRIVPSGSRRYARKIAVAATAVLALSVAACGGGASSGGDTASSGDGKTFVMAVNTLPNTLDIKDFSGGTRPYLVLLNSHLVDYDVNSCDTAPSAQKLQGQLAKSWEYGADRKSLTFTLKDNIKSQYGNPLTAEDVKWSLERGLQLSPIIKFLSTKSMYLADTNPIEVISPTQIKLNLKSATPIDVATFTVPTFTIFDSTEAKKHATADDPWANKWLEQNSDAFGPWQVSTFDKGNQITFTKNPGWPEPTGDYDTIVLKQIANSSDQAQLLQDGSVNYAKTLTWSQFSDLNKNPAVTVYACAPVARDWLVVQQAKPEFADGRVRQAISMAINRDELIKGAYAGSGVPALTGLLESQIPAGADVQKTGYNLDEARKLMADAGYPDGFTFTLNYNAALPGSQVDQLAILLQNQLKQIGITVNLNKMATGNDMNTSHAAGTYEAELWGAYGSVPDAYFDAGLIAPGAPNATWGYKSQEFTDLYNQMAAAAPGSAEYDDAVVKIANLNITDMPVIPLVSVPNIFAMTAGLQGVDESLRTIMTQPSPSDLSAPAGS